MIRQVIFDEQKDEEKNQHSHPCCDHGIFPAGGGASGVLVGDHLLKNTRRGAGPAEYFLFSQEVPADCCPDCGKENIRQATSDEIQEFEKRKNTDFWVSDS